MHPLGAAQKDRHPAFGGEGIRHLDDEPPADAYARRASTVSPQAMYA